MITRRAPQGMPIAVVFPSLAVNRFSINALVGAIEQDPALTQVQLSFPHPRDCAAAIEHALCQVGRSGTVVLAFSFMSSAARTTDAHLQEIQARFGDRRAQIVYIAGGPHPSGDPLGTLMMGFDLVAVGEGERSFCALLNQLTQGHRDCRAIAGLAFLGSTGDGRPKAIRTGKAARIELDARYPSIGTRHRRLGAIEIGRGCPHACKFCQISFLNGVRMQHRPLDDVLTHIEHLLHFGFKDIRFITPDIAAYLSDDGVHPDLARLEHALKEMKNAVGRARLKFGEFPSEARPEFLTQELVELLSHYTDARHFTIGAQSGSQRLLDAMHREHDIAAVERAVVLLATHFPRLRTIHVDFIAGLPSETEEDIALSQQLMTRLTGISAKVSIHAHAFMPLPGTPLQNMPPGEVGTSLREMFEQLAARNQEWGNWQSHLDINEDYATFRRAQRERLPVV